MLFFSFSCCNERAVRSGGTRSVAWEAENGSVTRRRTNHLVPSVAASLPRNSQCALVCEEVRGYDPESLCDVRVVVYPGDDCETLAALADGRQSS